MEQAADIIGLITGEAGALVVLALLAYLWLSGRIYSKAHVALLEAEHDELLEANAATQAALNDLSATSSASLENSRTILKIVRTARSESAGGESYDRPDPVPVEAPRRGPLGPR